MTNPHWPTGPGVDAASPLIGGGKHTFTVCVNVGGSGANWSTDLVPQAIAAYSLHEALVIATLTPLREWFPEEEED